MPETEEASPGGAVAELLGDEFRNAPEQEDAAETRFRGRADRRINQLLSRAKSAEDRARDLERQLAATTAARATSSSALAERHVAEAKAAMEAARFDGDAKAEAEAVLRLTDAQIAKREADQQQRLAEQSVQRAPQVQQTSDAMADWLERNPWFQSDEEMTTVALKFDRAARARGYAPESPEYFKHVDTEMRRVFPAEFDDVGGSSKEIEAEPQEVRRPAAPAAPRRSAVATAPSPRSVRLTPEQREFARFTGVSEQAYAAALLAKQKG
jgi:hypothetical protein